MTPAPTAEPPPPFMLRVCGLSTSGNCHKVRLILEWLGRPYEWIETDSTAGATRAPEFLALNPNGKIPIAEVAPGRWLAESNAILVHLAEGSPFWPTDPWERAQALQWLFFEQYSHEPYVAVARYIVLMLPADSPRRESLPGLREKGDQALAVMERHLAADGRPWFVGQGPTVADIALAAYTAGAPAAGFDLGRYPAVTAWLARLRGLRGYTDTPSPAPPRAAPAGTVVDATA